MDQENYFYLEYIKELEFRINDKYRLIGTYRTLNGCDNQYDIMKDNPKVNKVKV